MTRRARRVRRSAVVLAILACALLTALAAPAFATTAPHVATTPTPDTCAMCHRAHTATGDLGRVQADSWEMTGSALALGATSGVGDVQLCYVCHGLEALGAPIEAEIQSTFLASSVHTLAPAVSAFGPSVKYCSSCHDSHGANEVTTGTPYPRLLRSRTASGTAVFTGDAYCATCHTARTGSRFGGLGVWERSAHATELPGPASGTEVRCSICHAGHGSDIAPLIVSQIGTPALEPTTTITANDRTLCAACHTSTLGSYPGALGYTASHASSLTTVAVPGEWPDAGASRRVGECQVCHAPMGVDDGTGAPFASLLDAEVSAVCLRCHDVDGPAQADLESLLPTATASAYPELLAAISPETTTAAHGALAVWGTSFGAPPRAIVGPREYRPGGLVGPMATGDVDGDGTSDVVVAHTDAPKLTVFTADELKGLTKYFGPGELAIPAGVTAEFIAVADVFDEGLLGLPEVLVVDADTGWLYAYRYDLLFDTLAAVDATGPIGTDITGIATGDFDGDGFAEVVLTDAGAPAIVALTRSATLPDTFDGVFDVPARAGVRGPSVGDVWTGGGLEIAVANSAEVLDAVSVYDGFGALLGDFAIDAEAGARASATLVGNVLPGMEPLGTSGAELAVAIDGAEATSSVNVFWQLPAGGLTSSPQRLDTGSGYSTGSLASGDLDGDGRAELVVGNGGTWSSDPLVRRAPTLQMFRADVPGTTLSAVAQMLTLGGVERAGTPPALAVTDVGAVGPSRHPAGAIPDAHSADEAAPLLRHVECADCHDAHEATSTPTFASAVAPAAYGRLLGVFGVSVTNIGPGTSITYGTRQPVLAEWEVCLKCHSAYSGAAGLEGGRDIASEVNTRNVSVHAVQESVTTSANSGSFTLGWDNDSVLYCVDCHDTASVTLGAVRGPHVSTEAPILKRPYRAALPGDSGMLCYACHKYSTYFDATGVADTGAAASWFRDAADGPLHGLHVRDQGFACASCHTSHGSPTKDRLIREGITFSVDSVGGSCIGPCHPAPGVSYVR
jgi:predicted CXXCH cytochrome family protein